MKTHRRVGTCIGWIVLGLIGWGLTAAGDWNPGGSHKMHFPQLPDLSTNGVDVGCTLPVTVADDWQCSESGIVTGIHVWASWLGDGKDLAPTFALSIWSDNPTNASNPDYSTPSNLLWSQSFEPGTYSEVLYGEQLGEWWWDPMTQQIGNDDQCWQYNFTIPTGAFTQEVGTIYWLAVQVTTAGPGAFAGWKTSIDKFNDDAVWSLDQAIWNELRYPQWHPYAGQSIDLAFVIDGEPLPEGENPVDWGAVQWPFATTTTVGVATENIYGRVYEAGVTDEPTGGAGPGNYRRAGLWAGWVRPQQQHGLDLDYGGLQRRSLQRR